MFLTNNLKQLYVSSFAPFLQYFGRNYLTTYLLTFCGYVGNINNRTSESMFCCNIIKSKHTFRHFFLQNSTINIAHLLFRTQSKPFSQTTYAPLNCHALNTLCFISTKLTPTKNTHRLDYNDPCLFNLIY